MANWQRPETLTLVLGDEGLDVEGDVLVEVELARVERLADGGLVEQQEPRVPADLRTNGGKGAVSDMSPVPRGKGRGL